MTLNEQIMKLQTYKMFEGEDTVYVERDNVLKLLEQEPCEDAISREDALMALTGKWTELTDELIHQFIRRIKNYLLSIRKSQGGFLLARGCPNIVETI